MSNDNMIPVVDVTTEMTREQALEMGRGALRKVLERDNNFLVVEFGEGTCQVTAACDDTNMFNAAVTILSTVGAAGIGMEALEKMPPEVTQSLTLITGLRIMEQFVRDTVGTPPAKDKQH